MRWNLSRRILGHLPIDLPWIEPFVGVAGVFANVLPDRPRYGSDIDPAPVDMLLAFRDRPSQVISHIDQGWQWVDRRIRQSEDWAQHSEHWLNRVHDQLDPAAAYWLRWRVGCGGAFTPRYFFNRYLKPEDRLLSLDRLWALSDRLQGSDLRGGVDWQEAINRPGEAVIYLDPPSNAFPNTITPCQFRQVDWQAIADQMRWEKRPWLLTTLNHPDRRTQFIYAHQQVIRGNHSRTHYLLISNRKFA